MKGTVLAEAIRKAELRKCIPARMTSHELVDAAEALIVYAWLIGCISLEENVAILEERDELSDGLVHLLEKAKERIRLS